VPGKSEGADAVAEFESASKTLIDTHCHLEAFADPQAAATEADKHRVITVAVTSTPKVFVALRNTFHGHRYVRLALGLHPLLAAQHRSQMASFRSLIEETSFVGEVGLDFSREGRETREGQEAVFAEVLLGLRDSPKFATVHSRGAEARVLEMLDKAGSEPVVFHWFSGSLKQLERALAAGHRFSVNPPMLRSRRGRELVTAMPRDRVMTETDAPYARVGSRPAQPWDVALVIRDLAALWSCPAHEAQAQVARNFLSLMPKAASEA
jgi:TatD DNase family protein